MLHVCWKKGGVHGFNSFNGFNINGSNETFRTMASADAKAMFQKSTDVDVKPNPDIRACGYSTHH